MGHRTGEEWSPHVASTHRLNCGISLRAKAHATGQRHASRTPQVRSLRRFSRYPSGLQVRSGSAPSCTLAMINLGLVGLHAERSGEENEPPQWLWIHRLLRLRCARLQVRASPPPLLPAASRTTPPSLHFAALSPDGRYEYHVQLRSRDTAGPLRTREPR